MHVHGFTRVAVDESVCVQVRSICREYNKAKRTTANTTAAAKHDNETKQSSGVKHGKPTQPMSGQQSTPSDGDMPEHVARAIEKEVGHNSA